jgi:hypothetical protein
VDYVGGVVCGLNWRRTVWIRLEGLGVCVLKGMRESSVDSIRSIMCRQWIRLEE